MRRMVSILSLLMVLPLASSALLLMPVDVTKENQKEHDLDFTITADPRKDGGIEISVRIPLKGNLQKISRMWIEASDGNRLLFLIPLSFSVVEPKGKPVGTPKDVVAYCILLSKELIDKCSLVIGTGEWQDSPCYSIKLSSYVEKQ